MAPRSANGLNASGAIMRSLFSTRKTRSNKGVPRVAPIIGNRNVILINNTGVGHVKKARKTRSNKGTKRGPRGTVYRNVLNNGLGLAAMKIVGQRKTRKNKGVKRGPRGPRYFPRNTNLFM